MHNAKCPRVFSSKAAARACAITWLRVANSTFYHYVSGSQSIFGSGLFRSILCQVICLVLSLRSRCCGLVRWTCRRQHRMLLQRAWVQFPASMSGSSQLVPFTEAHRYTHSCTHIPYILNLFNLKRSLYLKAQLVANSRERHWFRMPWHPFPCVKWTQEGKWKGG